MVSQLKHRTLSGALIEEIRQAILSGRYPAGSQLRQDALAETYGVSRIPVREVLFQLEAEGLVRIVPQKGAIVSECRSPRSTTFSSCGRFWNRGSSANLRRFSITTISRGGGGSKPIPQGDGRRGNRFLRPAQCRTAPGPLPARRDAPDAEIVASLLQTSDRYTRVQLSSVAAMTRAMEEHAELIRLCRAGVFEEAAGFLVFHLTAVHEDLLFRLKGRE